MDLGSTIEHGMIYCDKRTVPYILRPFFAEAASGANHFHEGPTRHSGISLREDEVPGHIHERRGGAQNQPAGIQSPGLVQEQKVIKQGFNHRQFHIPTY